MRSLAGCVALAVMLVGSPLAAQDAAVQPTAAAAAPRPSSMPTHGSGRAAQAGHGGRARRQEGSPRSAAIAVAAPTCPVELAPPPPPPPPITLVLNTDLGAQRLTVIENGKAKYTWPISSGRRGFATPTGTFHPQWASKM